MNSPIDLNTLNADEPRELAAQLMTQVYGATNWMRDARQTR
jgi:hypothetical protein